MNPERIGKFINELRKEAGLTQEELANMLHVTDRAISNWERGIRIPDISFYKPLCSIFNISVNELLSGERIEDNKILESSNNLLIHTLNSNKKNKRDLKILIGIIIILLIILGIFVLYRNNKNYPKLDIYSLYVSLSDDDKKLKEYMKYDNSNIYFYGIEAFELCDIDYECYNLKSALENKQIDIDKIKKYLEHEYVSDNIDKLMFWDGGTEVYKHRGYEVLFCNTISGNNDIYFGDSEMVDELNGAYCGHQENIDKSFTRTYKVISSKISSKDLEFNDVTLENYKKEGGTVLINNSYDLSPGKYYEFTFLNFEEFNDTIENIFKYATLLKVKETDLDINEQVYENIIINYELDDNSSLNELQYVRMLVDKSTLTNTSARIILTDYSGHKYSYGEDYYIEEYKDGKWIKLEEKNDHVVNDIAYLPDKNGDLEFDINWEYVYGVLPKGKYRIVKNALIESNTPCNGECDKYKISADFELK